jgi:2-C-methyl-D-erythritol 4-phosphate cytidylyltransferase / 2-C-methyl-D-erythritol 2,4-cyclodiphosphate synthase
MQGSGSIGVLIVAAGSGVRAGGDRPKQYMDVNGSPVLDRSISSFLYLIDKKNFFVSVGREQEPFYGPILARHDLTAVEGGNTRQSSVLNGLEAMAGRGIDRVLIHDAARCLIKRHTIDAVLGALDGADGAAPALPVTDTLKRHRKGSPMETVARQDVYAVQTPQGFRFEAILAAHRAAKGLDLTDDLAVAERAGLSLTLVPGEPGNIKITRPEDFAEAERLLTRDLNDVRTGSGFDVHAFGPGDHVWLCGVRVPHDFGLVGHSDADVGLHAITDAILGAISAGDIGRHFPPGETQWRGAPSSIFLEKAVSLVRGRGGLVSHLDLTLICERPKVGPHAEAMRARVAGIAGISIDRVSIKATTTEKLGFTGRGEGIAAQAVATVRLPG